MAKVKTTKTKTLKGGIKGINSLANISQKQLENFHRNVFEVVRKNLPRVSEVLAGTRKWDTTQARLYLSMLNKVMPEVSMAQSQTETTERIEEMSQQELQQFIASEMNKERAIASSLPASLPPPADDQPVALENTDVFSLTTIDVTPTQQDSITNDNK